MSDPKFLMIPEGFDHELAILNDIVGRMEMLSEAERMRVAAYLYGRFGVIHGAPLGRTPQP